MVEVFKTNVQNQAIAAMVTRLIEHKYSGYKANFDLDDCDNILRIEYEYTVDTSSLCGFIQSLGFQADVLPDEPPVQNARIQLCKF